MMRINSFCKGLYTQRNKLHHFKFVKIDTILRNESIVYFKLPRIVTFEEIFNRSIYFAEKG